MASLDKMSPDDIAELLYLGHMYRPLKSARFAFLKNRFAYCAHDDGWFNKLYINYEEDLLHMITNIIPYKVDIKEPLNDSIVEILYDKVQQGLLIDFDAVLHKEGELRIPYHTVGRQNDMDYLYVNSSNIILSNEGNRGWLTYCNGWSME